MDNKQNLSGTNPNTHTDPLVQNISRQPSIQSSPQPAIQPNTQPTVQLPNRAPKSAVQFHSRDIGTKTAVQDDPFVKVEESFGDKVRRFFHLKPKQKADPKQKTETTQKTNSVQKNEATQKAESTQKNESLGSFLFTGKRKAVAILVIVIIIAETTLLILFLTGVFSTKVVETDSVATTANDEALDIYNNITNENSDQDTLDYWNSQFAIYEARKDYLEAYNLRIKASDFYLNREDKTTALTILRATKINYSISIAKRYDLYSIIATLATDLGKTEVAATYQRVAFQLSEKAISNGLTNDVESEIPSEAQSEVNDNNDDVVDETYEDVYEESANAGADDCVGDECEGYEE